jgi:hypothetical protein
MRVLRVISLQFAESLSSRAVRIAWTAKATGRHVWDLPATALPQDSPLPSPQNCTVFIYLQLPTQLSLDGICM